MKKALKNFLAAWKEVVEQCPDVIETNQSLQHDMEDLISSLSRPGETFAREIYHKLRCEKFFVGYEEYDRYEGPPGFYFNAYCKSHFKGLDAWAKRRYRASSLDSSVAISVYIGKGVKVSVRLRYRNVGCTHESSASLATFGRSNKVSADEVIQLVETLVELSKVDPMKAFLERLKGFKPPRYWRISQEWILGE